MNLFCFVCVKRLPLSKNRKSPARLMLPRWQYILVNSTPIVKPQNGHAGFCLQTELYYKKGLQTRETYPLSKTHKKALQRTLQALQGF